MGDLFETVMAGCIVAVSKDTIKLAFEPMARAIGIEGAATVKSLAASFRALFETWARRAQAFSGPPVPLTIRAARRIFSATVEADSQLRIEYLAGLAATASDPANVRFPDEFIDTVSAVTGEALRLHCAMYRAIRDLGRLKNPNASTLGFGTPGDVALSVPAVQIAAVIDCSDAFSVLNTEADRATNCMMRHDLINRRKAGSPRIRWKTQDANGAILVLEPTHFGGDVFMAFRGSAEGVDRFLVAPLIDHQPEDPAFDLSVGALGPE